MQASSFISSIQNALHAYTKMCEPVLGEFNIPQVSYDILMFLHNNPEFCTAQEISKIRHIKKNLVSVHVEKLVSAGLLRRSTVEGDRRKIALSCTEKAEPIIKAGLEMQKTFFERITDGVSREQWQVYKEIMDTIDMNTKQMVRSD